MYNGTNQSTTGWWLIPVISAGQEKDLRIPCCQLWAVSPGVVRLVQGRVLYYLRNGGTFCSRELLAKACLELTICEIDLVLYRLEGLNALKNEKALRN